MADDNLNENWNNDDNKKYVGKIDRDFVSLTEPYEVQHFIDSYLNHRKADVSDNNRQVIKNNMAKYPGRAPIKRAELTNWLDGVITVKS